MMWCHWASGVSRSPSGLRPSGCQALLPFYTNLVYTGFVQNVTLSADENLIERARLRAAKEKRSLNSAFREWLARYAGPETGHAEFEELMKQLSNVKSNRRFSRAERNER